MRKFIQLVVVSMLLIPALLPAAEEENRVVATIGDKVYTTVDFQR